MGSDTTSAGGYNCGTTMAGIVRLKRWKAGVMWEMKANKTQSKDMLLSVRLKRWKTDIRVEMKINKTRRKDMSMPVRLKR